MNLTTYLYVVQCQLKMQIEETFTNTGLVKMAQFAFRSSDVPMSSLHPKAVETLH